MEVSNYCSSIFTAIKVVRYNKLLNEALDFKFCQHPVDKNIL